MGFLFGLKLWFLFSIDLHHLHNNSSVNSCMKNNLLANHHLFRCDVILRSDYFRFGSVFI